MRESGIPLPPDPRLKKVDTLVLKAEFNGGKDPEVGADEGGDGA
jgi:hypothetical protein